MREYARTKCESKIPFERSKRMDSEDIDKGGSLYVGSPNASLGQVSFISKLNRSDNTLQ